MAELKKSLAFISKSEKVARIIFSPSHISEGRVSPKAFRLEILPSGAEDYISVLRNEIKDLKDVSKKFIARTPGDSIYGYTLLESEKIIELDNEFSNRNIKLFPKPSRRLPLHAGISMELDGKKITANDVSSEIDFFQKELALICEGINKF